MFVWLISIFKIINYFLRLMFMNYIDRDLIINVKEFILLIASPPYRQSAGDGAEMRRTVHRMHFRPPCRRRPLRQHVSHRVGGDCPVKANHASPLIPPLPLQPPPPSTATQITGQNLRAAIVYAAAALLLLPRSTHKPNLPH